MKKIIYALLLSVLLISCASHPGRVCGGPGGGRCVDNSTIEKTMHHKPIV